MKVTKETLIGAVLDYDIDTAQFFFNMGMYCLGCPHSRGESIEQACMAHGTDADKLIADINAFLEKKAANN
jgi:hybrid cluster-associated redox disulfide protein